MKRKTVHFGYKAHLAVDEVSGLVRQAEMTSANVHDSRLAEALIQGDEQGYFADKAYCGQAFREALERRGLVDGVAWRGRPIIRSKTGRGSSIPGRQASAAASGALTPR